jgi:hypothetical protein
MPLYRTAAILIAAATLASCSDQSKLSPFSSDGCSLFPDESKITKKDWCSCCFTHDIAYWKGGTAEDRLQADLALKRCVEDKTGNAALATVMYEGVRAGGSPYFMNWYRWGYGWSYGRKYQKLSVEEARQAEKLLKQYFESGHERACTNEPAS